MSQYNQWPEKLAAFVSKHCKERSKCKVCRKNIKPCEWNGLQLYEQAGFCHECACSIMGLYNYAHSGQFGDAWPTLGNNKKEAKRRKISRAKALRVYEADGFKCRWCASACNLSIDHIIPVSKGGTNDESNLRTLCRYCNSRKGKRFDAELEASL